MYGINWEGNNVAEAKFKVGDRVRFTDAVDEHWWFKAGETGVVKSNNGKSYQYIIVTDRMPDDGYNEAYVDEQHIEAEKPALKFKVGDRVVTEIGDDDIGAVRGYRDGRYSVQFPSQNSDVSNEFIWRDSELLPVGPKFKVGDRVRVIDARGGGKIGDVGQVTEVDITNSDGIYYGLLGIPDVGVLREKRLELAPDCAERKVEQDNEPRQTVETLTIKLDLDTSDFNEKLAAIGADRPHIVVLVKDGQPLPAHKPYIHDSEAAATAEAERLARNNPGQEFAVYQRVAGRVAEVQVNMKEVA